MSPFLPSIDIFIGSPTISRKMTFSSIIATVIVWKCKKKGVRKTFVYVQMHNYAVRYIRSITENSSFKVETQCFRCNWNAKYLNSKYVTILQIKFTNCRRIIFIRSAWKYYWNMRWNWNYYLRNPTSSNSIKLNINMFQRFLIQLHMFYVKIWLMPRWFVLACIGAFGDLNALHLQCSNLKRVLLRYIRHWIHGNKWHVWCYGHWPPRLFGISQIIWSLWTVILDQGRLSCYCG